MVDRLNQGEDPDISLSPCPCLQPHRSLGACPLWHFHCLCWLLLSRLCNHEHPSHRVQHFYLSARRTCAVCDTCQPKDPPLLSTSQESHQVQVGPTFAFLLLVNPVSLRLGLEVLCYPFFYHAALQRLGMVPARPLLPNWTCLIPFSSSSPLLPFSVRYNASSSITDCIGALLTSPLILLCAEHAIERWIYACVYEAVETAVIRPDKPDIPSRDANGKDRALTVLGLRRESPTLIRNAIHRLLAILGWALPSSFPNTQQKRTIGLATTAASNNGQTIEVGGTQVINATPLHLPVPQSQDQPVTEPLDADVITIPIDAFQDLIRSTTPPGSPTESEQNENDPRIRITSREGIVEMEVRLPPRILSTHTRVAEASGSSRDDAAVEPRDRARSIDGHVYHRVSQLSCEPAQMISAMVRAQLVGLAMLPFRMVTLRMIASHHLVSQGGYAGSHRIVNSLELHGDMSWRNIGTQLSRVALCGALELAIDLSLWGMQYQAITKFGQSVFGWGTL